MAILTNKPASVSADSTTSLTLNKADLQAKLTALNAGAYWQDQSTWRGVAFLFENANKQKVTASFDASGSTANLNVSEFFVDGNIECKRIDVVGFANDYYTIYRSDFTSASEFDIEITNGYALGGGGSGGGGSGGGGSGGGSFNPVLIPNGDFEQGNTGWFFANTNQTNKWVIGSAAAFSGTKSLYISNNNGTSATYTATTTSRSWAWTEFTVSSTKPKIRIKLRVGGEGTGNLFDYLNIVVKYDNEDPINATNLQFPTSGSNLSGGGEELHDVKINLTQDYANSWATYEIDLTDSIVTTLSVRLLFGWMNDQSTTSSNGFSVIIDNIEVVEAETFTNPLTWSSVDGHITQPDGGVHSGSPTRWTNSNQIIPIGQDGEFTFIVYNLNVVIDSFAFGIGETQVSTLTNAYFGLVKVSGSIKKMDGVVHGTSPYNFSLFGRNVIKITKQSSNNLIKITVNGIFYNQISTELATYNGELKAAVKTAGNNDETIGIIAAYKTG